MRLHGAGGFLSFYSRMSAYAILALAIALAMDAFAVSVATGVCLHPLRPAQVARMSLSFGFFQFLMPVLGWYLGLSVRGFIENWDHWVAFTLLAFVGGAMLVESFKAHDEECPRGDPTRGWALLLLSVATSIDAFAVGLSFSFLRVDVWPAAATIGVVCAGLSAAGMLLGGTLRKASAVASRAELLGGLILLGIGLKILHDHGVF